MSTPPFPEQEPLLGDNVSSHKRHSPDTGASLRKAVSSASSDVEATEAGEHGAPASSDDEPKPKVQMRYILPALALGVWTQDAHILHYREWMLTRHLRFFCRRWMVPS